MDDYDGINDLTRDELVRAVAGLRKENRDLTDNYNELEKDTYSCKENTSPLGRL